MQERTDKVMSLWKNREHGLAPHTTTLKYLQFSWVTAGSATAAAAAASRVNTKLGLGSSATWVSSQKQNHLIPVKEAVAPETILGMLVRQEARQGTTL